MKKLITTGNEATEKLKKGIDKLADAVKITLGPKGKNVVIQREYGYPQVTKDGVSVAKEIFLKDPIENMGAQMIKEVSANTATIAGDGTTTATVLAQSIISNGLKNIAAGASQIGIKRGMDKALEVLKDKLKELSIPISDNDKIEQIATISANNDYNIGKLIADAFIAVGRDGIVTAEPNTGTDTVVKIVEGMKVDKGYVSPHFINNPSKSVAELENPYILIYDKKISSIKPLLQIIEGVAQSGRPLLVICEDIDGEALATLVVNKVRGNLNVCAIKAPAFGGLRKQYLEDIAIATGGSFISEELGYKLEEANVSMLGQAEKIIVTSFDTTIIGGKANNEKLTSHLNSLKSQQNVTENNDVLADRISKITGKAAVVYVGATSEVEMKEKKDRIDDALYATKAAIEEGFVAGGGITYINIQNSLDNVVCEDADEKTGVNIVYKSLEEPTKQICSNAGIDGAVVIEKIKQNSHIPNYGYNAKTEKYENLIQSGVIDPAKVSRVALENAISVAGMVLTTDCVISIEE